MLEWYQNKRKTYVKMNEEPNIDLNRSLNAQLDSIENKGTSQFELEMRANLTIDGHLFHRNQWRPYHGRTVAKSRFWIES